MFTIFNTYKLYSDIRVMKEVYFLSYVLACLCQIFLLPWHIFYPVKVLPSDEFVRFKPDKLPQPEGSSKGTKILISFIKV